MRVFVTGSTGFVGTAVVKELISAGHAVLGLTRSDAGVEQLKSQGAEPLRGNIEDFELLKKAVTDCDAVIHLAFGHNFADFAGSCATDRAAIGAMGSALAAAGGNKALVITSGTMMLAPGKKRDEDDKTDTESPMSVARGASESVCLQFAEQGVRASVVRLPPTTHGPGQSGFTGLFAMTALQKGVAAYVGDGENRWCAAHRDDAAKVYRLAVEKAKPGSVFHAVAEEGVSLKDIAEAVGKQLRVPAASISSEEAAKHYGWFQMSVMADNVASSEKTKELLGWAPAEPGLIDDVPVIAEYIKANAASFSQLH